MKVAIFLATSINGYITKGESDSDWVNDWDTFTTKIKEFGCVLMGRKTYQASLEVFPFPDAQNIVLTKNQNLLSSNQESLFVNLTPTEVIKLAQSKGFKKLLLIGGQFTVTEFLKENLVDEMYLDVHPLFIGHGKSITNITADLNLTLINSKTSDSGIVTLHYLVNKS